MWLQAKLLQYCIAWVAGSNFLLFSYPDQRQGFAKIGLVSFVIQRLRGCIDRSLSACTHMVQYTIH